ncbi:MAG TPA: PEP-CTERM sorting domain-containing protein [Alphaproteobacteria bacterium]|nr:PEP-CTERM sorting domain-containing protein [Alphaproteobacteria bacterium]
MDLIETNGRSAAEKVLVTSSGILALAIGMGSGEARADLVYTSFTIADNTTYQSGTPVFFGPSDDPNGFAIQFLESFPVAGFLLAGNRSNLVAVELADPPCTSNCKLQVLHPGDVVDGALSFAPNGTKVTSVFKTFTLPDGNYYFGLDDVGATPDPFGFVELTITDGSVTLDQFAFQDVDGVGAQIPAAPEPAGLALFAVGGAAVLAARRKRRPA